MNENENCNSYRNVQFEDFNYESNSKTHSIYQNGYNLSFNLSPYLVLVVDINHFFFLISKIMTNLLCFSDKFVFSVSNNSSLNVSSFSGELVFSHNFDHPICAICYDTERQLLGVGVKKQEKKGEQPNLFVYSVNEAEKKLEEKLSFELPHEAIQVAISNFRGEDCVLALNSGDIDMISFASKTSKTLLGSIATGTAFIVGEDLIISGDRDARIRISRYPQTYDIKAFAFYHEEFVSSLDFIDNKSFVSGDGDGQIVTWNFEGESLVIKRLAEKGKIIRKLVVVNDKIYAIIENDKTLYILNNKSLEVENKLELNAEPITISKSPDGRIWIQCLTELFVLENQTEIKSIMKIDSGERDLNSYSLESQRVKCKKIIHKQDKGTEDYDMWRNPEKTSSRD